MLRVKDILYSNRSEIQKKLIKENGQRRAQALYADEIHSSWSIGNENGCAHIGGGLAISFSGLFC